MTSASVWHRPDVHPPRAAAPGPTTWAAPAGILATNIFIVAAMVHDRFRDGRTHAAYRIGLALCLAVEGGILLLTPTPAGRLLARGLVRIGDALAFLY